MSVRTTIVFICIKLLSTLPEGNRFLSSSKHPKLLWVATNLQPNVHGGWGDERGVVIWTADSSPQSSASTSSSQQCSYAITPLHAFTAHRASPQRHCTACLSLNSNVIWPSFCYLPALESHKAVTALCPCTIIIPQHSQFSCHGHYVCENDVAMHDWTSSTHAHRMYSLCITATLTQLLPTRKEWKGNVWYCQLLNTNLPNTS